MNPLPSFSIWQFAIAGLACALGPIIIHWLHRRRFRVVAWPAMEFLLRAAKQHRRRRQWRDIVIMALRCLAILFIGLALARPFVNANALWTTRLAFACLPIISLSLVVATVLWHQRTIRTCALAVAFLAVAGTASTAWIESRRDGNADATHSTGPVHAELWIDNSLSMAYRTVSGTSLDSAKRRAEQFIRDLPSGSQITIHPMVGQDRSEESTFNNRDDAIERLSRVVVFDGVASFSQIRQLTSKENNDDLPRLRCLFTDTQKGNWDSSIEELPEMQIIDVGPDTWENVWISDIRLPDGLIGSGDGATVVVNVSYQGQESERNVPVSLIVDGTVVASRNVIFRSEGEQQVLFQHQFQPPATNADGRGWTAISATVPNDRLDADNVRHLVLPLVHSLRVVFVDQYGAENEDLDKLQIGETFTLRRIMAAAAANNKILSANHVQIGELDQGELEDARLVVVAGIDHPANQVTLLREFVMQGGQLLVAAGGDFDPIRWQASAWRDGQGILPLPLHDQLVRTSDSPMQLDFRSLTDDQWLRIEGLNNAALSDFYQAAIFFEAVAVNSSPSVIATVQESERQHYEELAKAQIEFDRLTNLGRDRSLSASETTRLTAVGALLRSENPSWLLWSHESASRRSDHLPEHLEAAAARKAEQTKARVLATMTGGHPFAVERRIGKGRVMFLSSGLLAEWNLLARLDTALIYDRLMRELIHATLPQTDYPALEPADLTLPRALRGNTLLLHGPHGANEVQAGFLGANRIGISHVAMNRGIYRLTATKARRPESPAASQRTTDDDQLYWSWSANGVSSESQFEKLTLGAASNHLRVVSSDAAIRLNLGSVTHEQAWWYVALIVVCMLLLEMLIVGVQPIFDRAAR